MAEQTHRETPPGVRVRVSHTSTIKGGWSYETTVEVVAPQDQHPTTTLADLEYWLSEARRLGESEAIERNRRAPMTAQAASA